MNRTVLIVEDQFVEANYLRDLLEKNGYTVTGIARSVEKAREMISKEKPGLVILDIFLSGKLTGVDLARDLNEKNIAFIYLSANSNEDILHAAKATQPYGFLVKPFRERDLLVTLEIAEYRHAQSRDTKERIEAGAQQSLQNILHSGDSWVHKIISMARTLQHFVPFDVLGVKFRQLDNNYFTGFAFLRTGFEEYQTIGVPELSVITGMPVPEIKKILLQTKDDQIAGIYNGDDFERLSQVHPMKKLLARQFNQSSNLVFPFLSSDSYIFSLSFFRTVTDGYSSENLGWLYRFQQPISEIICSISPEEKTDVMAAIELSQKVTDKKPVRPVADFGNIIGSSFAMLNVMDLVSQVAPSDSSVLILGESGTGKEKIAACIHNSSLRKDKPFIKVNCAALPPTLIESELFGHEKGAFTGAAEKKIGKFEQADQGTIFLDEIGELPPDLQVKLLRVLQEKEVERLGSSSTIRLNIRILAATNRNLEKEVAAGRFRLDLYYRLNVFPVYLPPLRERPEDIPPLTSYFIEQFNRKTGKKITGISDKIAKKFAAYSWPGNIRELEHVIERAVLLTKGSIIEEITLLANPEMVSVQFTADHRPKTMEENERDHILDVLRKCNGKIWGAGGAAEILNLPPSTLKSRMLKLGIRKEFIR